MTVIAKSKFEEEIHDTKLRKQQESGKKLELLSLTKQRELEKKENQKALDEQKLAEAKLIEESKKQKAKDIAKLELQVNSQKKDINSSKKESREIKNKNKKN